MRMFVGMILGALLLTGAVYVYDASSTSTVSNGRTALANRTIVNWDVASNEWQTLKEKTQANWNKLETKLDTK